MPTYEHERHSREVRDSDTEETRPIRSADRQDRFVERDTVERRYADDRMNRVVLFNKIANVVWTITGLIEVLIGLRIVLRFIGANADNAFVDFIYDLSYVFVAPFIGAVDDPTFDGSVLEVNSLIAMLVYVLAAWAILRIVRLIFDVSEPASGA